MMQAIAPSVAIEPFPQCPALDGSHCVTSSLAKIFHHAGCKLSEDMLLGLGAGMGFIYWQMKLGEETMIFIGGRGNMKDFYQDLARRTGVRITENQTSSAKKAEDTLLRSLAKQQPVLLGADMGFLPWFDLPADYHFGGHTFVACGFDGDQTVLGSDIDQKGTGIKKGFYAPITLEQLSKARNSTFKPFPPKNLWLDFDFSSFRAPGAKQIGESITQTVDAHLNPPIKNFGVSGMRHTAAQLLKWPSLFNDHELRMNLFNLYIFIEIGGTGGGCFRSMYARFLDEAAAIARKPALAEAAESLRDSAHRFTEIALLFQDAVTANDLRDRIQIAADTFRQIADLEERTYQQLQKHV